MLRLIPRTIRGQLILGTALLQCLLVAAVFGYVYHQERDSLHHRTADRLTYQVHVLSSAAAAEVKDQHLAHLQTVLDDVVAEPAIRAARITDLSGNTLAYSDEIEREGYPPLSAAERRQLGLHPTATIFENGGAGMMAVQDIDVDNSPAALAWIYPDTSEDQVDLSSLLRSALMFALLAIAANALFSLVLARSVTRPLRGLLRGTKLLIRDPERSDVFPLKVRSLNEAGELTRSFNTMVAALKEQRAGLNETLALLDSMLANAPIGFAFFDRKMRYVRMNQFLAEMDHLSIGHHLGRTVQEIFPGSLGSEMAATIEHVFNTGAPARDVELHGELPTMPGNPRMWLTSLYPVRTDGDRPGEPRCDDPQRTADAAIQPPMVRWVGAVIVDATDRKLSEELLRRTEKLAATGQLAASIAHEINNPLEAVTNLLYLLHQQPLDSDSRYYADMAQQEIARVSHITQQTLRFYRQSSSPAATSPADLLDSVLGLHQGRLNSTNVKVVRRYRDPAELLAFSGEMRQLFANLVGNALDAMPQGGRLLLTVRTSRSWNQPAVSGVRIVVADTGCGMTEAVRRRIFEPFFTTKELTGTGLGLWISSEIIAKHQGTVRVRSRPADNSSGSGTVFMLFFPFNGLAEQAGASVGNRNFASAEDEL
ncbi:MAG TPA: ATP-binding protein [Acidobacteriaceae bacterium]|nr:ATP-binding protein [Acidobacteriaceae bacterium]